MPLSIYLFGTPHFERDGEPVEVNRRKAIALLAYLAVTGQPHGRDALATLFWPEHDQTGARANLRRDLSRLRRVLGKEVLQVDRQQVGIVPANVVLDVADFQVKSALAQRHGHAPEALCSECLLALETAVSAYTGDFMAGFTLPDSPEFDEWQYFQREGYRQLFAHVLRQLLTWYTSQGDWERGIAHGRRWLSLDPLHEAAHRDLMKLYAWSGQQAAALRQYQECERLLAEELGVEPEEETVQLYEAIRTRQLAPPVREDEGAEPVVPPPPLAVSPAGAAPAAEMSRYTLEELLAVGGQGELYRGRDQLTGQPVVIKQLKPELVTRNTEFVRRFRQEGEMLRRLNHPNIVQMLATWEANGRHALIMEYVPGGSLRQLLDEKKEMPLDLALDIALELADALTRAHHLGIIHRDLKPENVLLAEDGTPRLTDFGVAMLEEADTRLTPTGSFIGSPVYMAPELLRGETPDARSDVWSFGVLLFEILAGQPPFAGERMAQVLIQIINEPTPNIHQLRPEVPASLVELLYRMLAKKRDGRPASMRLVAAELEAIRQGRQTPVLTLSDQAVPAMELEEAETEIRPAPRAQPFAALPEQTDPFLGREAELDQIEEMLANPDSRVLTIVGLGGMGKSRLALEAARQVKAGGNFADGVAFVPLAGVDSIMAVPGAIADVLGVVLSGVEVPLVQLLNFLAERELLLVLDNVEHLLAPSQPTDGALEINRLLVRCPRVKLLITSREPLQLAAEWRLNLEGLPVPVNGSAGDHTVTDTPAVQLFAQTAVALQPDFSLTEDNVTAVVRVCELAAGMPLAIKLAATWLRAISLARIVTEMERGLNILAARQQDLPRRQRSMRVVFDYSWDLLIAPEQELFQACSVFRGGFDEEAAQAVAAASPFILAGLVERGLLLVAGTGMHTRYQMHELTRQYAGERLAGSQREADICRAHARHFADYVAARSGALRGAGFATAVADIAAELNNITAAWNWLLTAVRDQETPDWVIATLQQFLAGMQQYYYLKGPLQSAKEMFLQAVSVMEAAGWDDLPAGQPGALLLAGCRSRAAFFALGVGEYDQVDDLLATAVPWLRQWGDAGELAVALSVAGKTALLRGQRAPAEKLFEETLDLTRQADDEHGEADTLKVLGVVAVDRGEYEQALDYDRQSLALFEQMGFKPGMAMLLHNIGTVLFRQEAYEASQESYEQALAIAEEIDYRRMIMEAGGAMGGVYRIMGRYDRADRFYRRAVQMARDMGEKRIESSNLCGLGMNYLAANQLDAAESTLKEGIAVGWRTENIPNALAGMATLAQTWAQKGRLEEAMRLAFFVSRQRAAHAKDRDRNDAFLAELIQELPPSLVTETGQWAEEQSLPAVADWVLGEG